jgi:hypothetical protein
MEKTPIQLSKEELDNINDIGNSYRNTVMKFGELQLEKIEIQHLIETLNQREEKLVGDINELKVKEKTAINSILEKYGEGSLSLKDGTFIPA